MPPNFESGVIKFCFVAVLKIENECVECRKCYEFVFGVIFLLISSLAVYLIAFCFIENVSPKISHIGVSEWLVEFFDKGCMFQAGRVDDLKRVKPLDSRYGSKIR